MGHVIKLYGTPKIPQAAPPTWVSFAAVGNPIDVYGFAQLGQRQDGCNFNSVTRQPLSDWPAHWFMIANEGGDPIIVDLQAADGSVVRFEHGAGSWEYGAAVAASIG
jgi:hypothetical protein